MSFRTAPRTEMVQRVDRVTSNGETVMELEVDVDRKRGDGMTRGPDYAHGPTLLSRTFISDRPSGCCQQGHCICDLTATGGDRKARNGLDDDVLADAGTKARVVKLGSCGMCKDIFASFVLATQSAISYDAVLGMVLSVLSLLGCRYYLSPDLGVKMDWNVVSMAVFFPISQGIAMGFKRREQALEQFAYLFGNLRAVWGAIHCWKVKRGDTWASLADTYGERGATGSDDALPNAEERAQAARDRHQLFGQLLVGLVSYSHCKRGDRSRHAVGLCGAGKEQRTLNGIAHEQKLLVDGCIARVQRLVQEQKMKGLPGGETHRLDQ